MKVCTVDALAASNDHSDRALVVLRRVGVVMGLLFGLGLVALVVADGAAAEEQVRPADVATHDGDAVGGLGRLTESLTRPLTEGAAPVVGAVVEPVAPVVRAGADVVAPVLRPVADAVEPVLRPVVDAVTPVLEPVLDIAAPVTEPLLDATKPVVTPVSDAPGRAPVADAPGMAPVTSAPGLAPVTDAVSGERGQDRSQPVPPRATSVAVHEVTSGDTAVTSVHSGPNVAPGSPGPLPGLPIAPVPLAVTGGGVVGGTGSGHGGDTGVVGGASGVVGQWTGSGRGPPGAIVGTAWFGYDDRDHPS